MVLISSGKSGEVQEALGVPASPQQMGGVVYRKGAKELEARAMGYCMLNPLGIV